MPKLLHPSQGRRRARFVSWACVVSAASVPYLLGAGASAQSAPPADAPIASEAPPPDTDAGAAPSEAEAPGTGAEQHLPEAAHTAELTPESVSTPASIPDAPSEHVIEVTVQERSKADRMRRSAEAVHVVETEQAQQRTADLGEVLARTQGVGVQRAGGLGSDTRFSLNGLSDDQIRFFLDGVPLELSGYPFGLANVPVNLVERVEIYRGVVPIRFGADALGGAVNLVSDQDIRGTHGAGSIQAGSFGTYRLTASARHLDERSGFFTRASAFVDHADNDYPMNIEVAADDGSEVRARVYRFHDRYAARGGNVEAGFVDRPWADRLLLRAFVTGYDKEIQHNLVMTFSPYGDVELGELSAGGTLRYEHVLPNRVSVDAVIGYAHRVIEYSDLGECVYDWFGQCLRPRAQPGERVGRPQDQTYWDDSFYGRLNLGWPAHGAHTLRLSLSPTFTTRTGEERALPNPAARDPLAAQRDLAGVVTGLEYQARLARWRLENVVFVKDYVQLLRAEDPLSTGAFRRLDRGTHRIGFGDSLRYLFVEWLYAKASYEWATRMPRPDEVFGNAFPIQPNLGLEPELSHNVNLGVTLDALPTDAGELRADLSGFLRYAEQLIVLVGDDNQASYQNVYSARSAGVELTAGWSAPGEHLALDGNVTYVDFRNTSTEGGFAENEGRRIPNRPYLFANGSARVQARDVAADRDELALSWSTRYVHPFFRGWEGLGASATKLSVDAQLLHALALTYVVEGDAAALSFTGEVQNLTDQAAFDFFGVPRPGRAFYFKATVAL